MDGKSDYTGTHKVILPADYMNSIEAVCELHSDQLSAVAMNLDCPGLRLSVAQKLLRLTFAGLCIWLIPGIWLTCF